ncbi:AI-2E family transporter [Devosia geojensis]|uniref:AI-2E family transporter n=1 Tax=Devosia geojensis TaxID=443610 RepID=UPI000A4B360C|nr:AI-2E family transporter [Devosia geojensis]
MARRMGGVAKPMSDTQFERVLANAARLAVVAIGLVVALVALQAGQVFLAPVFLAIVTGLMFGPLADRLEAWGVVPALSAGIVVLTLIGLGLVAGALFSVPLAEWIGRAPAIWEKLQRELASWQGVLQSFGAFQEELSGIFGESTRMEVRVEDGNAVTSVALLAPSILAQFAIFLASLYFFVATRDHIRISMLTLCVSRRMRWRTAHMFRDIEQKVSRYLISITIINVGVGIVVSIIMWAIGMPSPLLWGALAAVLNYIPYVGMAVMWVILLAVGLGTRTGIEQILLPVGCYMVVNFLEGQLITPHFIGRAMTLNPFVIFLSITFWLWAWGPIGGVIAVPALLIAQSVLGHVVPSQPVRPRRPVRRTRDMSRREELLANAAQAIREQNDDEDEERKRERMRPPGGTAPSGVEPAHS